MSERETPDGNDGTPTEGTLSTEDEEPGTVTDEPGDGQTPAEDDARSTPADDHRERPGADVEPPPADDSSLPVQEPSSIPEPAAAAPVSDEEVTSTDDARRRMSRMTRRSLVAGAAATGAAYGGWRWLMSSDPLPGDRLQWPLRRVLETNERLAKAFYSRHRRVKEWPVSRRDPTPRVNGRLGLDPDADPSAWRLRVEGLASGSSVELTIDDIRDLPRTEMVTELRCIEGWSDLIHWAGVRMVDLMAVLPPATRDGSPPDLDERPHRLVRYVALETPDRGYWVGLDMPSALHPQTLLAYEINEEPLTWEHGAPLRLVIPVKYGIKHLKRIGLIRYTDTRPADYWAERKYDWYAGL